MPAATPPALGRNSSVLLDVVRFSAALAVFCSHLPNFYPPSPFSEHIGNQAVCVFFVLSGFVIRFVTETRLSNLTEYLIDRASRIYSVVLPTLLFTFLSEPLAAHFFPRPYPHYSNPDAFLHVPTQIVTSLTFTTGFWGYGFLPLSNGAFWSLTFEVVYYLLYGLLRYTRVARWFLVPLILLAVGPAIFGLFPIWLFGALLYDVYIYLRPRRAAVRTIAAVCAAILALLVLLRHPILHMLTAADAQARVRFAARVGLSTALGRRMFTGSTFGWLSRFSPSYFLVGLVLGVTLLLLMLLLDRNLPTIPRPAARAIRLVADSTFTLYLIHIPFLILVFSIVGHPTYHVTVILAVALAAILLSILLAIQFDHLKNAMRTLLRRAFLPSGAP